MSAADLSRTGPATPPMAVGEREAARLLGVSVRTLYNWRRDGIGPAYRRVGARLLYPTDGLRAWLNGGDADAVSPAEQASQGGGQ